MIDRVKIRALVQDLHERLRKERKRLPAGSRQIRLLEPAFVAQFLGLTYEIEASLGSFIEAGVRYQVAGLLDRNSKRIVVSSECTPAIRRFTAAHEIGHWLLHPDEVMHRDRPMDAPDSLPRSKIEAEAEYFAACLLMPPNLLKRDFESRFGTPKLVFDENVASSLSVKNKQRVLAPNESTRLRERLVAKATEYNGVSFESLVDHYGVSASAMAGRLHELSMITVSTARGLQHTVTDVVPLEKPDRFFARTSLLPATSTSLSALPRLDNVRLVVLHHALRDTSVFLQELLRCGAVVGCFVVKPNSVNELALEDISNLSVPILQEPAGTETAYSFFENSPALGDLIVEQIRLAKGEGKKLVLIDVGGYYCKPLLERQDIDHSAIAGVVEVTTFGHRRYVENEAAMKIPVISVARSELKEAEAVHVGVSVIRATEDMLQEAGLTLSGKIALVIGYGMIGRRIARALQERKIRTIVHDRMATQMLLAHLDGFETQLLPEGLAVADLVFSSTGGQAVGIAELASAKNGVILISGGSRKQEFDVEKIEKLANSRQRLTSRLEEFTFTLPDQFKCIVANEGKAANFIKDGTPEEVIDLVFAEVAECVRHLLTQAAPIRKLEYLPSDRRNHIAEIWLARQRARVA